MHNSQINTLLIDGYLDEPSCLGVPPYISPHIRYTYGALLAAGIAPDNLDYITIDSLRDKGENKMEWLESFDLIIIIAGTTVPGHYLGGKPISLTEIEEIGKKVYYPQKVLGGPVTLIKRQMPGFDHICGELAAVDLYRVLTGEDLPASASRLTGMIADWARIGAEVTRLHPSYPHLVCELETFRGCPRRQHCSFCSERLKNKSYQRPVEDIITEVKALAAAGNHFYRLGCQTDLLLYQHHRQQGELVPNPGAIEKLYSGIRRVDPELKVLHLDNINPAVLTSYPNLSRRMLETITTYNIPGDTAAFGLESADPVVLEKNNIASNPETTLEAITIMNEIGGQRIEDVPRLLPGINLLHGLIGERPETMEYNYQFLLEVLNRGLMLRRINIRQVATLDSYPEVTVERGKFEAYKEKINEEINRPLLKRVFPVGTILRDVLTEIHRGRVTYGRQRGTYPILVGIPGEFELRQFMDVRVIDHGYRSLTALPWPFKIKKASIQQLTTIPGIGREKANRIFINQPETERELRQLLGNDFPFSRWQDWFELL